MLQTVTDRQEDRMSTTIDFDLAAHVAAIERDDPAAQADAYAEDAIVEIIDRDHSPASPLIVRGRDAMRSMLDDVSSRNLSHDVVRAVADGRTGAAQVRCRYPDGTVVYCSSAFDLEGGRIARETQVTVWDA
jgi:ketosteroid isomerase-like protein